jgi:hypothetical protein
MMRNFGERDMTRNRKPLKELVVSLPAEIPPVPANEFDTDKPSICNQIKSFASQLHHRKLQSPLVSGEFGHIQVGGGSE